MIVFFSRVVRLADCGCGPPGDSRRRTDGLVLMTMIAGSNRRRRFTHILSYSALALLIMLGVGCGHRSANDYLTSGDQAMQNTRLSEAESDYEQAAKAAPNDPQPQIALASLYLFEHKPQQAEPALMKALELAPNSARAHALLAEMYAAQSQMGLAEAQYRAAVVLDPRNVDSRLKLGMVLQKEGKLGGAEAEYRTAMGLQPRNAHAHLALAELLNSEPNRQSEAQSEYAQVKALSPSLVPASTVAAAPSTVANSPAAASIQTAAAAPVRSLREFHRRFLLTHDSPVYESMSNDARVVGQVRRGKFVHVTAIAGPWIRIQLRNGTIGFIPATTVE